MNIFKIAWRSIQQRGLASLLTAFSMALGVLLVVSILLILGVVSESFRSNSTLGYNMIIGARGGALQLVLNTVYHLSQPIENLPYSYYLEFVGPEERPDGTEGRYAAGVKFAIPMGMGDYYRGFRVVGTSPKMFDDFLYDSERGRKYEFAQGRNFKTYSPEHGYFEAVLGSAVAKKCKLKVGDAFSPTHGSDEGDVHDEFFVVGILKPSGTPNDRAAFVNLEGFLLLEGHVKPLNEGAVATPMPSSIVPTYDTFGSDSELDEVSRLDPTRRRLKPLSVEEREVTSILVRTEHPAVAMNLKDVINSGVQAQSVQPIREIYELFKKFVDPVKWVLLSIATMVCITSGVSILVSIYNSMSDRRHEIAVMRALGAGRQKIMTIVLTEAIMLSLAGGLAGWFAGHVLIKTIANPIIEERTGVTIGLLDMAPPIRPFAIFGESPLSEFAISSELLLIPLVMLLAVIVGFLPAVVAYRTDVAKALG